MQEIIAGLTLLIGGLIAFFMARSVSNPITALTQGMRELADGNFDVVLPGLDRKDEIGNIARGRQRVQGARRPRRRSAKPRRRPSRIAAPKPSARPRWRGWPTSSRPRSAASSRRRSPATSRKRVALDGKTGLVLNVGTPINGCATMSRKALDDLVRDARRARRGRSRPSASPPTIRAISRTLKNNANATAERIGQTIAEIKRVGREVDQRLGGNLDQHHRSVAAHRGAGREPGADLGLDGGDVGDREEERRERPAGQPVDRQARATSPIAAARWWPRRSTPWRGSRNPRARSPTSSA